HLSKEPQPDRVQVSRVKSLDFLNIEAYFVANNYSIPHQRLSVGAWSLYSDEETAVFEKIRKAGRLLGEYIERKMYYGIKTGLNEAFVLDEGAAVKLLDNHSESAWMVRRCLGGEEVRRYHTREPGERMIVVPSGWTRDAMKKEGV